MTVFEILTTYCKIGDAVYSPLFGEGTIDVLNIDAQFPIVVRHHTNAKTSFLADGRYSADGECMLFPSKNERSWKDWLNHMLSTNFKCGDAVIYNGVRYYIHDIKRSLSESGDSIISATLSGVDGHNTFDINIDELSKAPYDPFTALKYKDYVISRFDKNSTWHLDIFAKINVHPTKLTFTTLRCDHNQFCLPENDETKPLIGTFKDAPAYYDYSFECKLHL